MDDVENIRAAARAAADQAWGPMQTPQGKIFSEAYMSRMHQHQGKRRKKHVKRKGGGRKRNWSGKVGNLLNAYGNWSRNVQNTMFNGDF